MSDKLKVIGVYVAIPLFVWFGSKLAIEIGPAFWILAFIGGMFTEHVFGVFGTQTLRASNRRHER